MATKWLKSSVLVMSLAILAIDVGCTADSQASEPSTEQGVQQSSVSAKRETETLDSVGTPLNTFHDASGKVTVSVFRATAAPAQHNENTVTVGDGDMIAIGGGGTATDQNWGALLTASFPTDDLSGWTVRSKDHNGHSNPHLLTGYVIGLKIAGMSRADLLNSVYVARADSGTAPHPEATAGLPSGNDYVLLGGGFQVFYSGGGSLATASFPSTQTTWTARSKDHYVSDPANIRSYAIAIRRFLPVGQVAGTIWRSDSGTANHPSVVVSLGPGYALTGGGGDVHYNGAGNMLWRLEPATSTSPNFTASSMDHETADPSSITGYALGIRIL